MKKITSILMSMVMLFSISSLVVSANSNSYIETFDDEILNQVLEQENNSNNEAEIIEVEKIEKSDLGYKRNSATEKAIKIERNNGLHVELDTIIPFKITDDGIMVNSFEYANNIQQVSRQGKIDTDDTDFVDVVITSTAYYDKEGMDDIGAFGYYYRPTKITMKWKSGNGNANVARLEGMFDYFGILHDYPHCTYDYEGSKVNGNNTYSATIRAYAYEPDKGRYYTSTTNALPYSRVISCSDGHGGYVTVDLAYTDASGNHQNTYRTRVAFSRLYP